MLNNLPSRYSPSIGATTSCSGANTRSSVLGSSLLLLLVNHFHFFFSSNSKCIHRFYLDYCTKYKIHTLQRDKDTSRYPCSNLSIAYYPTIQHYHVQSLFWPIKLLSLVLYKPNAYAGWTFFFLCALSQHGQPALTSILSQYKQCYCTNTGQ